MRDDFSEQIKSTLAHRVGFRCSNPGCRKPTSGPQTNPAKSINIGVAAHIKAASIGGKRYDKNQTPVQRKSADNGIWLCQSCSKLIDSDDIRYTVELLLTWKTDAEADALRELEEAKSIKSQFYNIDLDSRENTIVIGFTESDKVFALWLSMQLISQGYFVWCSLLNIEPGEYSRPMIENWIKNKAAKFLFVLSNFSNKDSQILQELRFAYGIMPSKQNSGFVIPVQVEDVPVGEQSILLQGTSPIDFSNSWSKGLNNLLNYLDEVSVPKDEKSTPSKVNDLWRLQFNAEKGLKYESEEVLSNWFPIQLPENIFFHEIQRNGIGLLAIQKENLPFPGFQNNIYLISFASASDFVDKLGANISIKSTIEINLKDFLDGNYDQKLVKKDLAWNFVIELINDAWNKHLSQTKLKKYILANNRLCYFFPIGFTDKGDNKVFYQGVDGKRNWRFLSGKHISNFWHFGIQGRAMLYPEPALIIKSHGLASSDGLNIWDSKEKLHTSRRRWYRNWWNSEWRDRLLASISYLANEKESFKIPLGSSVFIYVSSSPIAFRCPISYFNGHDTLEEPGSDDDNFEENDELNEEFDEISEEDFL